MMKKIKTEVRDLYLNEMIHQITYLIKHRKDYFSAAKIMSDNSVSITNLTDNTFKLSQIEIAKLTDQIIESRR